MRERIEELRDAIEANAEEDTAMHVGDDADSDAGVDENGNEVVEIDEFEPEDETPEQRLARLAKRQKEKQRRRKKVIFRGLKMFLNREVPVELLDFSIKAFHGTTAWESHPASPFDVHSASITHHVIDRPLPKSQRIAGRTYVQPQWIFDSINAGFLLPTEWYAH